MQPIDLTQIPKVLQGCTLEAVKPSEHKTVITKYLEMMPGVLNTRQGLYLWGDYGQGKSALAAIMLKGILQYDKIGLWINAKEWPGYVINHMEWMEGISYLNRALMVPLLVIDEFQIRQEVKFQESCIEDLLRARIALNKPTIFTSNIVPSILKGIFPAFHSVLQECCRPVHVKGYDWREANKGFVVSGLE